ncbi:hypothetical protein IL306_001514 [Fusarium sp. DS 682]|nr:hypothetical protein IL306_001514 [Fusarium sp. DS 682]
MQGSASYPAALGSSKWIASFLAKHRTDDDIYAPTINNDSSNQEAKFRDFFKRSKAELRNVFSLNEKKKSEAGVDELPHTNSTHPEQKGNKSTWATLFDTKSGKKLHMRTKSAPVPNSHVPHLLTPISEELEGSETQAYLTSPKALLRKPVAESVERSVNPQADGDNVSVLTTCTTIIQQDGLGDHTVINHGIAEVSGKSSRSDPVPHRSRAGSNDAKDRVSLSTTSDKTPLQRGSDSDVKISGALLSTGDHELLKRDGHAALQQEINKMKLSKNSPSKFSLRSVFSLLTGGEKSNDEGAKIVGSRKLRHKARFPSRWIGTVKKTKSGSSTENYSQSSSQDLDDLDQNDGQCLSEPAKQNDTFKPLPWNLPAEDVMGELIREFSGDLKTPTPDLAQRTPASPNAPSLRSYPSEFDLSMDHNLTPRPAKLPVLYSHHQDHGDKQDNESTKKDTKGRQEVQSENNQARLVKIKIEDDGTDNEGIQARHDPTNNVHPPRTWQMEERKVVEIESLEEAYARHRSCLDRIDQLRTKGLLGPAVDETGSESNCEPEELEEQRLVREMTEDFQLPPNEIISDDALTAASHTFQVLESIEHQNANLPVENPKVKEEVGEDAESASDGTEIILTRVKTEERFFIEGWEYRESLNGD